MRCAAPGEELPAAHDDIGISGADLQTVADATGHLGRDHARARAEKRVIDHLAGPAVIGDRAAHALDRLLGAVSPALLALPAAIRIHAGDFPERGLRAVALPVAGLARAHRVPAGLVLPVKIAAAQDKVRLGPDDLSAKLGRWLPSSSRKPFCLGEMTGSTIPWRQLSGWNGRRS